MEIKINPQPDSRFFIQIGAGAGDLDSRADYRDGFTEFIKSNSLLPNDKIILVEPNPLNISTLKKCWSQYQNTEIYELGIVPKNYSGQMLPFYYTQLDAPHFQVASFNSQHVLKHYPELTFDDLIAINIPAMDLEAFVNKSTSGQPISLLALDIEGLDAEVLLDTNFKDMNVDFVSFEHLHLGSKKVDVLNYFEQSGFILCGNGIDHQGFDYLFKKLN